MRPLDFTVSLDASAMAVRVTLADLRMRLAARDLPPVLFSTVELALAEALNNIVEHAYTPNRLGRIVLVVDLTCDQLRCTLRDRGEPLPGLALPSDGLPDSAVARDALPEGGFGWLLIRQLTDGLIYARSDDENILTLKFNIDTPSKQP